MQQGLSLTAGSDAFQGNALGSQDRASMVAHVSQELKKVESRFYTAITSSDMKEIDSPQDSDTTRDEESVQAQEQSNQLDYILGTAVSLKEIGYEINEEIGVHCRLLEEIEDREDQIFAKHRSNERLFQDWMKTKGSSLTFLWGLVIFLFITFIYVLLW